MNGPVVWNCYRWTGDPTALTRLDWRAAPGVAVPPIPARVRQWSTKPARCRAAQHSDVNDAVAWMREQITGVIDQLMETTGIAPVAAIRDRTRAGIILRANRDMQWEHAIDTRKAIVVAVVAELADRAPNAR